MRITTDQEVRGVIEAATIAAVDKLQEEVFPQQISGNFQMLLELVIECMLLGIDPFTAEAKRRMGRSHYTTLPKLLEEVED